MKLISKLMTILGFNSSNISINNFIIGNTNYVIFEFSNNEYIIKNDIINKICIEYGEFYWFKSYKDLENYSEILYPNIEGNIFIFIG
jgi:hypothetical protein